MEKLIHIILLGYKKHMHIDENQEAILRYSLYIVQSTLLGFGLALAVAWMLGIFMPVLIMMLIIALFRSFSGGAHCSNMINCAIYGAVVVNTIALFIKQFPLTREYGFTMMLLVFFFCLWSVGKYAPADTPEKPITNVLKRKKLRTNSLIIVSAWYACMLSWFSISNQFHLLMYLSAAAMLWQSFTLTKAGYQFCHMADKILNKIIHKRSEVSC